LSGLSDCFSVCDAVVPLPFSLNWFPVIDPYKNLQETYLEITQIHNNSPQRQRKNNLRAELMIDGFESKK